MSREDDFSISDLRRKREQQAQQQPASPQRPMSGGDFRHKPSQPSPQPTAHFGNPPQMRPVLKPFRKGDDDEDEDEGFQVDIWRMLGALKRRWRWIAFATVVLGLVGFAGGYFKGRYTVAVQLIRRDVSSGNEAFKYDPLTPDTLLSYVRSWDVARRVEAKAQPPVTAVDLMAYTSVDPEKGTDLVVIKVKGKITNDLVTLANLYATETVAFTRELQLVKPREAIRYNENRAASLNKDIKLAEAEMTAFRKANDVVDPKAEQEVITKRLSDLMSLIQIKKWEQEHSDLKLLTERLTVWKKKLFDDRAIYTEQNPIVQDALKEIRRLEEEIAAAKSGGNSSAGSASGTNAVQPGTPRPKAGLNTLIEDEIASLEFDREELNKQLSALPEKVRQHVVLKAKESSLDEVRNSIERTLLAARQYESNAEGYFRISRLATQLDVDMRPPMKQAKGFGVKGAAGGFFIALALVILLELKDRTMKTAAEVERVTGLRVIAALGDLDKMTPEERNLWAFRAWTVIAGQLNTSANHGMVCGFVSSGPGEGRSTWMKLLGEAATRRGLRVLTVSTKPSGTDEAGAEAETVANEKSFTEAVEQAMAENLEVQLNKAADSDDEGRQIMLTLSASALAFPAEVVNQFNSGNLPAAHIPLPGWVWNRERRQQWQLALSHWMAIDNLVLLVELPPASVPESLLLAENLPQIIWLVDSGKASISDTKEQLVVMRHAKCQIVGAILNHEPDPLI